MPIFFNPIQNQVENILAVKHSRTSLFTYKYKQQILFIRRAFRKVYCNRVDGTLALCPEFLDSKLGPKKPSVLLNVLVLDMKLNKCHETLQRNRKAFQSTMLIIHHRLKLNVLFIFPTL